jgi:D-sedoheptulose 7-phosphate isomerase
MTSRFTEQEAEKASRIVRNYIDQITQTIQSLSTGVIIDVAEVIKMARRKGKRIYIFGNGGSAATATHMASDLSKGCIIPGQPRIKAISLCTNIALLSAWANDSDYSNVFAEQLDNLIEAGDIALGISGSGNSRNVLNAIELAKSRGALTIGFCGFGGGKLAGLVDIPVVIHNNCMEQIEDIHLVLEHMITSYLRVNPDSVVDGNK